MELNGLTRPKRPIEHIFFSKMFRPTGIDYNAGFHGGIHRKRDSAGDIEFDKPSDSRCARALCGQDQVYPGYKTQLGNLTDGMLAPICAAE